jgi:8-amino-7-oxononanoate synthase
MRPCFAPWDYPSWRQTLANLIERWQAKLANLREAGRLRTLRIAKGADFSSNDYLSYAATPWPATSRDGTALARGGSASRLLRGHHAIWDEVESALAMWHGAEAALVFTSGYAANQGLLTTLIQPDDFVASDSLNHASIIDGLRLAGSRRFVYQHCDLEDLDRGLRAAPAQAERFIVTESLFSMDGDVAPLADIVSVAERHGAHVVVDEAHATGCFGALGSGLVNQLGLRERVLATMHTGGKALGVHGAYVCGPELMKQMLVNQCRHFLFTTALPPVVGSWWLDAITRVRDDDANRTKLHAATSLFRRTLASRGVQAAGSHYIVPVVLGDDKRAVEAAACLQSVGLDIRAIRPPTVPEGSSRLRIAIHANHDDALIVRAASQVAEAIACTA